MAKRFWIVLYDDDCKVFNVCGLTTNDTDISNRTVALQKIRRVRCSAIDADRYSREDVINNAIASLGYALDENLIW